MIKFANIQFLHLFWLIPLLVVFYVYVFRKKADMIKKFGSKELMEKLTANTSIKKQKIKAAAVIFSIMILIIALARPQIGTKREQVKREGQDILVAIDVSKSMLAEDISPNRLEKAKHEISKFIDMLQGDRIGIIPFAGEAFVQCPLTLDYGAAKLMLSVVNPNLIPLPGTNITAVIEKAIATFEQKERKYKVLLLITDGEDHSEEAEKYSELAAAEGIVIFTVGIGSPEGVPIPEFDQYGNRTGYKKDSDGQTVVTKLNELMLEKIALNTNGKYYNATPEESELDDIFNVIAGSEKKELGNMEYTQFADRFQYLLILLLVVLVFELFLSERIKVKTEWKGRFF
ncbi:VWA domain-containing protein [candidate division KSB1 bacterium]